MACSFKVAARTDEGSGRRLSTTPCSSSPAGLGVEIAAEATTSGVRCGDLGAASRRVAVSPAFAHSLCEKAPGGRPPRTGWARTGPEGSRSGASRGLVSRRRGLSDRPRAKGCARGDGADQARKASGLGHVTPAVHVADQNHLVTTASMVPRVAWSGSVTVVAGTDCRVPADARRRSTRLSCGPSSARCRSVSRFAVDENVGRSRARAATNFPSRAASSGQRRGLSALPRD